MDNPILGAGMDAYGDWYRRSRTEYDALVMPTVPIVAPKIDTLNASETNFFEANRLLLRNPSIINLLDGCAVSLPIHRSGDLPVGLMLACTAMSDARLLSIALAVEDHLGTL
jgi:aspartyl-tRNA(Asn)/glutamyl-tRNA(Gln) amidotransferase subunit A